MKKKIKLQKLIFNKKIFQNKTKIRKWINNNGYIIDNRLLRPILNQEKSYHVRQKNPNIFIKKSFKLINIAKGVKGVKGIIKK